MKTELTPERLAELEQTANDILDELWRIREERDQLRAQLNATADKAGSERRVYWTTYTIGDWNSHKHESREDAEKRIQSIRSGWPDTKVKLTRITEVREVIDEAGEKP